METAEKQSERSGEPPISTMKDDEEKEGGERRGLMIEKQRSPSDRLDKIAA